jgi:hypothetical protein
MCQICFGYLNTKQLFLSRSLVKLLHVTRIFWSAKRFSIQPAPSPRATLFPSTSHHVLTHPLPNSAAAPPPMPLLSRSHPPILHNPHLPQSTEAALSRLSLTPGPPSRGLQRHCQPTRRSRPHNWYIHTCALEQTSTGEEFGRMVEVRVEESEGEVYESLFIVELQESERTETVFQDAAVAIVA